MDNIICDKLFTFHCSNSFEILIFFYVASFRHGLPTNKQIHRLNQNALVSLSNTNISIEKVKINVMTNPHTTFLAPTNATVDIINAFNCGNSIQQPGSTNDDNKLSTKANADLSKHESCDNGE